jgi:hypothetical protein
VTYGKSIEVGGYCVLNILCDECGMVGTQVEEFISEEHNEPIDEIWHEPKHYLRSDLALNKTIKLRS